MTERGATTAFIATPATATAATVAPPPNMCDNSVRSHNTHGFLPLCQDNHGHDNPPASYRLAFSYLVFPSGLGA